jgi:hypothetical protein
MPLSCCQQRPGIKRPISDRFMPHKRAPPTPYVDSLFFRQPIPIGLNPNILRGTLTAETACFCYICPTWNLRQIFVSNQEFGSINLCARRARVYAVVGSPFKAPWGGLHSFRPAMQRPRVSWLDNPARPPGVDDRMELPPERDVKAKSSTRRIAAPSKRAADRSMSRPRALLANSVCRMRAKPRPIRKRRPWPGSFPWPRWEEQCVLHRRPGKASHTA